MEDELEQERILEEEGRLEAEGMRAMRELRRVSTTIETMAVEQERVAAATYPLKTTYFSYMLSNGSCKESFGRETQSEG